MLLRWLPPEFGSSGRVAAEYLVAIVRRSRLAPQPLRAFARDERRLAVARARPDCPQRLRDPTRHELVVARGVRPLVQINRSLAQLARVRPGLLAGQQFGEPVRPITVCRDTPVHLSLVTGLAIRALQTHTRPSMLRVRTHRPGLGPTRSQRRHDRRR
jgi:hypothetical protein